MWNLTGLYNLIKRGLDILINVHTQSRCCLLCLDFGNDMRRPGMREPQHLLTDKIILLSTTLSCIVLPE